MQRLFDFLLAFTGTNIDNFILIAIMLAVAADSKEKRRIVAAQYIGLALLVGISLFGTMFLQYVPLRYVRCLGLIPVFIGIRGYVQVWKAGKKQDSPAKKTPGLWTLVLLHLSNGMDNISVYIPIFEGLSETADLILLSLVFAGLMTLWCFCAHRMASLKRIYKKIREYSDVLVPGVYVLLGIYILLR